MLALDSALIETLQQFWQGKLKTPEKKGCEYFVSFLTRTAFREHFDEPLAVLFYRTIRCGLLHQSEAEGTSRIKRGPELPLVSYNVDRSGIVINTHRFHEALEQLIDEYVAELRKSESATPRRGFLRKMNYICRIEEKASEEIALQGLAPSLHKDVPRPICVTALMARELFSWRGGNVRFCNEPAEAAIRFR